MTLNVDSRTPLEILSKPNHIDKYVPEKGSTWSAGFDLRADLKRHIEINYGDIFVVSTGIYVNMMQNMEGQDAMMFPELVEAQVRPRSGLAAKHGISIVNSPGTIDMDYQGEIKVILTNQKRLSSFCINPGMRIAQLVFTVVANPKLVLVDDFNHETERGSDGFGSTGV